MVECVRRIARAFCAMLKTDCCAEIAAREFEQRTAQVCRKDKLPVARLVVDRREDVVERRFRRSSNAEGIERGANRIIVGNGEFV